MGIKGHFWVLRIDCRWYNDTEVIAMESNDIKMINAMVEAFKDRVDAFVFKHNHESLFEDEDDKTDADFLRHMNQPPTGGGKKKKKPQEVHSDRYYSREPDMVGIGDSITFMKDGLVRTKVLDEDENYPSYLKKLLGHKVNEVVDGMKIISIEK